jgi:hypothetical protein
MQLYKREKIDKLQRKRLYKIYKLHRKARKGQVKNNYNQSIKARIEINTKYTRL